MYDWKERGKLIVDQDKNGVYHFTYWDAEHLIYVRDGRNYPASQSGPHFLDLGIMGHCTQRCFDCYMAGKRLSENMKISTVDALLRELSGTLCQVSFGGAGDPIDHEGFWRLPPSRGPLWVGNTPFSERAFINAGLVHGIARCVTINPRGRAFTDSQISPLVGFDGIGISCGYHPSPKEMKNIARVLDQIAELSTRGDRYRLNVILHVIVGDMGADLRRLLHLISHPVVDGILLLAKKRSPDSKLDKHGPFYDRKAQTDFWRYVRTIREASGLPIAVDSCLAKVLHPSMFEVDHRAMHPCDAGRFSAYVHADGKMWLCSCGKKPVRNWEEAVRTPQVCDGVLPPRSKKHHPEGYSEPPLTYDWPNPSVVIQRGPMTNSSSASYFVIGKPEQFAIRVMDYKERCEQAKLDIERNSWAEGFLWTEHNNRLVRLTQHEWAAWCARDIAASGNPEKRKRELDRYTFRIWQGERVYYLVANRDDEGIPPTRYNREDISPCETVVLLPSGESH
jgi:hypothetical protein